jgi:hypothetical protein
VGKNVWSVSRAVLILKTAIKALMLDKNSWRKPKSFAFLITPTNLHCYNLHLCLVYHYLVTPDFPVLFFGHTRFSCTKLYGTPFQVHPKDVNKFQQAYCSLLKGNLDGLKKLKKTKTKAKATQ